MITESQIGDIWLLFVEYIADKKQVESAAERYVELLLDSGVRERTLEHIAGVDPILEDAIAYYLEVEDDEEEELDF